MKNRLPVLSSVVLLALAAYAGYHGYPFAQQPTEPDSETQAAAAAGRADARIPTTSVASHPASITVGDQLLLQAITQLERRDRDSIAARLRHQVSLGGRQLYGAGNYWQQGSGDALRVRWELQIAGGETSLLQVSNGRFLWTDRRLPTGRSVTRLDLRQLRNETTQLGSDLEDIGPGQATWSPIRPELVVHYGGLPKLLSALADSFTFLPPQAMRLTVSPPLVPEPATLPVFAVVGHWRPQRLAAMVPKLRNDVPTTDEHPAPSGHATATLPARLPQEVLILFGQSDLFPYRVEFRRLLHSPLAAGGVDNTAPYLLSPEPLVLLEFAEVSFNVPIAAGQFDYSPGDTDWDDRTAEHIDKLRSERRQQMAARQDTERKL